MGMAVKRSTTVGIIVGIVAGLVLIGIVGVVAVPRVWGPRGFCDESTGVRLQVVAAFQETDDLGERAEAEVELAQDTAGDLQDHADRVRWPSEAGGEADEVAEAWQAVADADPTDAAAVQEAAQVYVDRDDAFQDEHCGGGATEEDLEGLDG
jgi:hypothetical protein